MIYRSFSPLAYACGEFFLCGVNGRKCGTDGASLETVKNVIEVACDSEFEHHIYENGKCVSIEVLYDPFNE